jgi:hypothetical protein
MVRNRRNPDAAFAALEAIHGAGKEALRDPAAPRSGQRLSQPPPTGMIAPPTPSP